MQRRSLLAALAAAPFAAAAQPAVPSVLVLDFELIEDHPNPAAAADQARRIAAVSRQLRAGLADAGLYRVVEPATVPAAVDAVRAQHETLYACVGCAQAVGTAARTDLVLVGWVQKVSELILNLNVELRDSATERVVLAKSVDLRGNTDDSWMRAVRFLLRDWAERRAANPAYGR